MYLILVYIKFQVRASALFVPEYSDLQLESDKYFFTYSIRMSLKPEGCIVDGMRFGSCQLYWRHWIIRENDDIVSDVNGEAVIGKVCFQSQPFTSKLIFSHSKEETIVIQLSNLKGHSSTVTFNNVKCKKSSYLVVIYDFLFRVRSVLLLISRAVE